VTQPSTQTEQTVDQPRPALAPGAASGIGSWPGGDALETARVVFGQLGTAPHIPYLPELPARGPGADVIGRGASMLVDLPVDLQPSGWRLVDHPGRDAGRARSWLRQDLDVLAEVADGYTGPLKLQVAGPWTLAASLILTRLERAVVDPGACRDLVESLAEGVRQHVLEVARLVPGASLVVQLDEPSVPAVLNGMLPTASGFGRLRPVEAPVVAEGLSAVLDAATSAGAVLTVVHCCDRYVPVALLGRTSAGAIAADVSLLDTARWDQVAEVTEAGTGLWAGIPVQQGPGEARPDLAADAIWVPWRRLGLAPGSASSIVLTPACGLAGSSPAAARAAQALVRQAADVLAERAAD
jgi:methionine synthase II (cobalamin-independent)